MKTCRMFALPLPAGLTLLAGCSKQSIPSMWSKVSVVTCYDRDCDGFMFRDFINLDVVDLAHQGSMDAVITDAHDAAYYFDFILSTPQALDRARWETLPDIPMHAELSDAAGQRLAQIDFTLHQTEFRLSGPSASLDVPLPSPYQTYAYLQGVRASDWSLRAARVNRCGISWDAAVSSPPDLGLTAVALRLGSK